MQNREKEGYFSKYLKIFIGAFSKIPHEVYIAFFSICFGIIGTVLFYVGEIPNHNIPHTEIVGHLFSGIYAYDGRTKNPSWVLQVLRPGIRENMDDIRYYEDKAIPAIMHQQISDYANSGFEIAPLLDSSKEGFFKRTFPLSTTSPQVSQFHKIYWEKLNSRVMELSNKPDISKILVITGPLFLPHDEGDGKRYVSYQVIGENNVAVPTHFFKAIFYPEKDSKNLKFGEFTIKSEIYVVPNQNLNEDKPLDSFRTSFEDLEKISGIVFPNDIKQYLINRSPSGLTHYK